MTTGINPYAVKMTLESNGYPLLLFLLGFIVWILYF
jgi:hypothetical protein